MLELGVYKHYKGRLYQVVGLARHSEDESLLVVYYPLYGGFTKKDLWVRPYEMFIEKINFNGAQVPRFQYIRAD